MTWASRDAQQSPPEEPWLDVAHAQLPDLEARISRVTAWALGADRLGLDYGLRVPGEKSPPERCSPPRAMPGSVGAVLTVFAMSAAYWLE